MFIVIAHHHLSRSDLIKSSFHFFAYRADERDVTQVLWAQYMDIVENGQQIGLVDVDGNARPTWHAFHFYAQMPTERVVGPLPLLRMHSQG